MSHCHISAQADAYAKSLDAEHDYETTLDRVCDEYSPAQCEGLETVTGIPTTELMERIARLRRGEAA